MEEPGPSRPAASTAVGGDFPELLGFCARAEALIAELLLLSDRAPPQFADRRFDSVLFDFRYLDSPGDFESRIEGNIELEALEDQLRESCGSYMQRFFSLLDGAVTYHEELCSYLNDLQEGLYVHCTLDHVLENNCACQLLVESMALFGCLILLMEHKIGGLLRERLLVAHLRYERCFSYPNLEQICELCRRHAPTPATSANSGSSPFSSDIISIQKPEDLLRRFLFPEPVLDAVITCLRNGDVYNNIRFYPDPQHRTTALSLQARHLYVLLFYSDDLLHRGLAMREIVDRFFKDNWVVPIFLHFSVDLLVSWDAYKEAKLSLVSCLSPTSIHDISLHHYTKVTHFLADLDIHIHAINKEYVLDNSLSLLSVIRECNFTLRWLLLHRMTSDKKARDLVISVGSSQQVDEGILLQLLLKSAKLEFEVKQLHAELLKTRESTWYEKRHDALECMKDLSQNYLGTWAASCKFKNKTLKDWLEHLSSELISLNYTLIGSCGRTIHRVLSTLKDIEMLQQEILLKISTAMDYVNAEQPTHLVNRINQEALQEFMQGLQNMSNNFDDLMNLDILHIDGSSIWQETFTTVLEQFAKKVKLLHSSWGPLVEKLATIGQLQLVRTLISFKLRSACKQIKANTITSAVEVLLSSLYMQKGVFERGDEDETVRVFLHNIKEQQNFCGLFPPLQVIYISEDPPMFLTRLLSLFSISQLSRYVLDVHLGNLTSPLKRLTADFSAVIIGLGTLLWQFDSFYMTQYLQFMVQYIRTAEAAFNATTDTPKGATHSSEVVAVPIFLSLLKHLVRFSSVNPYALSAPKAVFWLMSLCKYMDISRNVVESCLPASAHAILQS
ncbi:WASH complex subunit strumpellin-like protein [Dichanthelium oligosanthes]|uniref:WASH complex subunit strumpellin-like protein n=1 Tax=Dichanthelium oligosanthes TaxID=888268 RepID=A0A1E5WHQ3_9POAL|nr:WASH complex subunit strumpellin-like protein [Dichanthelium oligosanthes]